MRLHLRKCGRTCFCKMRNLHALLRSNGILFVFGIVIIREKKCARKCLKMKTPLTSQSVGRKAIIINPKS